MRRGTWLGQKSGRILSRRSVLFQVQCGAHHPQKQRWQRLRAQAPIVRGVCCNSSAWAIQRGASTTVVRTLSQDPWMRGTALFEQASCYGAHRVCVWPRKWWWNTFGSLCGESIMLLGLLVLQKQPKHYRGMQKLRRSASCVTKMTCMTAKMEIYQPW